jgi:LmbE family N-acetylglucosaminyl deacetylase
MAGVVWAVDAEGATKIQDDARVALVVAHPDDETLWAGGTLLLHPGWDTFVAALCRKNDPDRAPRFARALERLHSAGGMADLDDGPGQAPLRREDVQEAVLSLLPRRDYDLIVTHAPWGEYTRHLRHEETSRAVLTLLDEGRLRARALWLFAYEDGGRAYAPRAEAGAGMSFPLPSTVWKEKYAIITEVYGFAAESWEALATPREEGFWVPSSPEQALKWAERGFAKP